MNLDGTGLTRRSPVLVHRIAGTFQRQGSIAPETYDRIIITTNAVTGDILHIRYYDVGYVDSLSLNINTRDVPQRLDWPTLVPLENETE